MADLNRLNDDDDNDTDRITDIQSSVVILQQMLQIVTDLQWNKSDSTLSTATSTTTTSTSSTSSSSSSIMITSMNHYSQIPLVLQQIYDTIYTQTSTIHHTVTKYTLLIQQLSSSSSTTTSTSTESSTTNTIVVPIIKDLIQSCRILVACIMSMYNNNNSNNNNHHRCCCCCRASFTHMKKAIRNILYSIVQLLEKSCSDFRNSNTTTTTTTMAQATGMVWDACNVILEKKVPLGNRNAIRRDLLSYQMEGNDTIQEFQSLCDASSSRISSSKNNSSKSDDIEDEDNEEEYYTTVQEISIVTNCIGIMKCSRGALRIALDVMDTIDQYILQHCSTSNNNGETNDQQQYYYYSIMETIYEQAYHIGYNVTDFGATLYPPLDLLQITKEDNNNSSSSTISTFYKEFQKQSTAIQTLLQYILDIADNNSTSLFVPTTNNIITALQQQQQVFQLNTSTIDLIHAILTACTTRTNDIDKIILDEKERQRQEDSNH